ncbi:putative F-box protein At3g10430 [Bidens hawaiensis]|uniref:putative F-box protein At3g10430 n=1 Tax=Bidens hawaiensis TaxID=980011 RepID=UPI00404B15F8
MSDHIPFEIQVEIMKRLPVISLIQCLTVLKTWKSLIDSSDLFLTRPRKYEHYYVIGCCHGLLCFFSAAKSGRRAAIWNSSIRRAYDVAVPNVADQWGLYNTALGFGVCPITKDPKIVKITYANHDTELENISSIPFQVEVFMLSTGAWRTLSTNLPRISVSFCDLADIDGVVYWLGADRITINGGLCYLIMSFDITIEEFEEINLPNCYVKYYYYLVFMVWIGFVIKFH